MSKYWLLAKWRYFLRPTLDNYIFFRFTHFRYCAGRSPVIDASVYLDNLSIEIKQQLNSLRGINRKSLILTFFQKALDNKSCIEEVKFLFEKTAITQKDIHEVIEKINLRLQDHFKRSVRTHTNIAARTYLIGTHIYLELENREEDYEGLVRNKKALLSFVSEKFGTSKLSPRIADMKNFSYKKILQDRKSDGAKGQLKPQLRQIIANPGVFGPEVSKFATGLMKEFFDES